MNILKRVQARRVQRYVLTFDDVNKIGDQHPFEHVAYKLWGDQALWYLIADVNPVRDPSDWSVGDLIVVPIDNPSTMQLARQS